MKQKNKEKGSAIILAILILTFFMALSMNMYFISTKKSEKSLTKILGTKTLTGIDIGSSIGLYEYKLAAWYEEGKHPDRAWEGDVTDWYEHPQYVITGTEYGGARKFKSLNVPATGGANESNRRRGCLNPLYRLSNNSLGVTILTSHLDKLERYFTGITAIAMPGDNAAFRTTVTNPPSVLGFTNRILASTTVPAAPTGIRSIGGFAPKEVQRMVGATLTVIPITGGFTLANGDLVKYNKFIMVPGYGTAPNNILVFEVIYTERITVTGATVDGVIDDLEVKRIK